MEVTIRPIRSSDAESANVIRREPGVQYNTLALPSEREEDSVKFFESLSTNEHVFAAEVEGKLVGVAGLHVSASARMRHKASVGIMVSDAYQGKGIGRKLMEKLMEMADQWLLLERVELSVYADNERAIKLYESLGFIREGTKRKSVIRAGQLIDEHIMGRLRSERL